MWRFVYKSIVMALVLAVAIIVCNMLIFAVPNDAYILFEDYGTQSNLALLEQRAGEYDTVFIGDSRIKRSVIPAEFDAITGTRSINAAVSGTVMPRANEYIRYILTHHADGLKNIVISFTDFYRAGPNYTSDSILYTFSPDVLLTALQVRALPSLDPVESAGITREIVSAATYKYFGLGTDRYFRKLLFPPQISMRTFSDPLNKAHAGFMSFEAQIEVARIRGNLTLIQDFENRRAQFVRNHAYDQAAFIRGAAWLASLDFSEAPMFPETAELLELADAFEEKGVHVYFVLPPRIVTGTLFPTYSQLQYYADYEVLSFIDPAEYPELYLYENGFDVGHLNTAGAHIFTRILGEEFVTRQN